MSVDLYVNGDYLTKNPRWHSNESPWKAHEVLRMLERNHLTPQTICEVGCGAGEILRLLQKDLDPHCIFQGYEISPQAFEMCKQKENEHLHFYLADFTQERTPATDLILVMDVIEHLEDYFTFMRDLHPKSRYKIIQFPLDLSVRTLLRGCVGTYRQHYGHLHYFTKDIALQALQDLGYHVLDYFYTTEPLDTQCSWSGQSTLFKVKKLLGRTRRSLPRLPGKLFFRLNEDLAARIWGQWRLLVLVE